MWLGGPTRARTRFWPAVSASACVCTYLASVGVLAVTAPGFCVLLTLLTTRTILIFRAQTLASDALCAATPFQPALCRNRLWPCSTQSHALRRMLCLLWRLQPPLARAAAARPAKGAEDRRADAGAEITGSQGAPASVASRQAVTMDAVQHTAYTDHLNQVLNDTESALADDAL
jgi:hypothetical protein